MKSTITTLALKARCFKNFQRSTMRQTIVAVTIVALSQALLSNLGVAQAQEPAMKAGDIAVTGFSGIALPGSGLEPGVDPIDATVIDTEGSSFRVFDISKLGVKASGKQVNVPTTFEVKAKDIGQVFGVTLDKPEADGAPNIYLAATSLYGLQIMIEREGKLVRLVKGEPGAQWMPGQFGIKNGGGPGTIWKIDGTTREVSLFADIKSGANPNTGPGLGALAYDAISKNIYVPNLETGYVDQVDMDGNVRAIFDHGTTGRVKAGLQAVGYDTTQRISIEHSDFSVETPSTWGFTDNQRLVLAVAVQSGRLYYSVAAGPQIWSVGLDKTGGFVDDARLELDLAGTTPGNFISAIAFDGPENIYLTQRGSIAGSYDYGTIAHPNQALVLHYSWDEDGKRWSDKTEEFAVSLKPPHRATNGGIGLGYGHNDDGSIKTDVCRATLWISGDNLNDPESDRAINGLQGMAKTAGQAGQATGDSTSQAPVAPEDLPELDAPNKSWLIDYDGKHLGDDSFGHIGALAIYAPGCDTSDDEGRPDKVADADPGYRWPKVDPEFQVPGGFPEDPEQLEYPEQSADSGDGGDGGDAGDGGEDVPDPGTPGLDITKSCDAAAIGGVVKCTIKVENTGTLPLTDPIVVSDDTSIAAGPGAGGLLNVAAVTPDGPEWTCTPVTPTVNLTCGLPPEHLPPGTSREFVVDIDTGAMLANGNVGFSNCASLGAPYTGTACDNGGTDISVKKIAQSANCSTSAQCTFTVEITNNSSTDFTGQLQLTDVGAALGAGTVSPFSGTLNVTGDLGCATGNPGSIGFTCLAAASLGAGQTNSYDLTVDIPAAPDNYWLRNCIFATAPGNVPTIDTVLDAMRSSGEGGTLGTGAAADCAWVAIGTPPPTSNLKVSKTSTGRCEKVEADDTNVKCDFNIAISNSGPSDFSGSINIAELTGYASSTLVSNDPNWTVTGPAPPGTFALNPTGPVVIPAAPGSNTINVPISVITPRADVETPGNSCNITNTATILSPVAPDPGNRVIVDDSSTAVGNASLLEYDEGGAAIFLCDPTNLKTTKVAKGPCTKVGSHWRCEFDVDVQVLGPDPYKGNIEVVDFPGIAPISPPTASGKRVLPGGASNEISWTRLPGSTKYKYTFNAADWPDGKMPVGAKVTLSLAVDIPDGNYCSLYNEAQMTFPVQTRHNNNNNDDKGDATAKIPRPECKRPAQCTPQASEFRTKSGVCACKKNFMRDYDGKCVPDRPEPVEQAELKVEKTGPGKCTADKICTFNLRLSNVGTGRFNGPVAFVDGMTDASGNIVSDARVMWISPTVGCSIEPHKLPFGCKSELTLEAGQSRSYTMAVKIPARSFEGKGIRMTNCLMVEEPAILDAKFDNLVPEMSKTTPGDSSAKNLACHSFTVDREAECTRGMQLNNDGLCECPPGTTWNGRTCSGSIPPEELPLACWSGDWLKISSNQVSEYKRMRYTVKPRSSEGRTIWCARAPAPPSDTKCLDGSTIPAGTSCPEIKCPGNMNFVSQYSARRLRGKGARVLQLSDGRWCAGEVPQDRCKQVWKDVCTMKPERVCRKITKRVCRNVPRQDCRNITKQDCTMKPERVCRKIRERVCSMVPRPSCRNITTQTCKLRRQRVCRGTGEFRECKREIRKVCRPVTRRKCSTKMERVCPLRTTTNCTTRNRRVCQPVTRRKCSTKMERVCKPATTDKCETVQKRTCKRRLETVCN